MNGLRSFAIGLSTAVQMSCSNELVKNLFMSKYVLCVQLTPLIATYKSCVTIATSVCTLKCFVTPIKIHA